MKRTLLLMTLAVVGLSLSGCVSAWMAAATGKKLQLPSGMPRAAVVRELGAPKERSRQISDAARWHFSDIPRAIAFVELFEYRGKLNARDEGSGQATANALTLGVGEIFLIPATAADIAKRSVETHRIYVFFDGAENVVGFMVNPNSRYVAQPAPAPTTELASERKSS